MMQVQPFSYEHSGDSFPGRLDSRAKLIMTTIIMVAAVFSDSYLFSGILSLLAAIGIAISGMPLSRLWIAAKSIMLLAVITILFHVLFAPSSDIRSWHVLGLHVSPDALFRGCFYALRLTLFVLAALFLTLSTTAIDLAEGVIKLCRPLRAIRVPVDDLGLILSLAFRFIPILRDELVNIRRAQTLRGLSFAGGYFHRIRLTVPLLVPVFLSTLNRADTIAMAIESRGYVHNQKRSYFSRMRFGMREWCFLTAGAAIVAILLGVEGRS